MQPRRQADQNLIDFLESMEGFRTTVYPDAAGLPTIGYGHLLSRSEIKKNAFAKGITRAQGGILLRKDIANAVNAVNHYVTVSLNQNQFDALVSFSFNIGVGAFQQSTALRLVNQQNWPAVPGALSLFNKITANGQKIVSKGLALRREKEGKIFIAPPGTWPDFSN